MRGPQTDLQWQSSGWCRLLTAHRAACASGRVSSGLFEAMKASFEQIRVVCSPVWHPACVEVPLSAVGREVCCPSAPTWCRLDAGFGSLIVNDAKGVSEIILAAARHVQPAGQRILLSRSALVLALSELCVGLRVHT